MGRWNVLYVNRRPNHRNSLGNVFQSNGRPHVALPLPAGGHPTATGGRANVKHWVRHIDVKCIRASVSASASTCLESHRMQRESTGGQLQTGRSQFAPRGVAAGTSEGA